MLISLLVMTLQAAAPAAMAKHVKDIPPPLTNGVFVSKSCEGEGCSFAGKMQWMQKAAVFDRPAPNAKTIGWITAREWAEGVDIEVHSVPRRGIVRNPKGQADVLAKNDVVYYVHYEGEGWGTLWRSGQEVSWADPDVEPNGAVIAWDPERPNTPETVHWVKVKRKRGPAGWVRDLESVRCSGLMDRDADCPKLP